MFEMLPRCIDMVAQERAARAACLPVRTEHEMIGHELRAILEQVAEGDLALATVEQIALVDSDPRQRAPLRCQGVALAGQLLLADQQSLARGEPFLAGADTVIHDALLFSSTSHRFRGDPADHGAARLLEDGNAADIRNIERRAAFLGACSKRLLIALV